MKIKAGRFRIADTIGYGTSTASAVREFLDEAKGDVVFEVDSFGGSVFSGVGIAQAMRDYAGGTVTVEVGAIAASAASVITFAADRVAIHADSSIMIHRASLYTYGNTEDLRKDADLLDSIDRMIFSSYLAHSKVPEDELRKMFEAETWFIGKDDITNVFKIDEVLDESSSASDVSNAFNAQNSADLSMYVKKAENDASKIDMQCVNGICETLKNKGEHMLTKEELEAIANTVAEAERAVAQNAGDDTGTQSNGAEASSDVTAESGGENSTDEITAGADNTEGGNADADNADNDDIAAEGGSDTGADNTEGGDDAEAEPTDEIAPYDENAIVAMEEKIVALTKEVANYRAKMRNLKQIVTMGVDLGVDAQTLTAMIEAGDVAKASEIALNGKSTDDGAVTAGGVVENSTELTEEAVFAKLDDKTIENILDRVL